MPQQQDSERYVDAELHQRLTKINQLSSYEYFNGTREHALINTPIDDEKELISGVREKTKQDFFANPEINPHLSYPTLKKFNATAKEGEYLQFKNFLKESTVIDPAIKKIYLWKVNEKIAENRMLQAAQVGDDRRFTRYSQFIFGKPDKEIFRYTIGTVLLAAQKALHATKDVLVLKAAERLLATLQDSQHTTQDFTFDHTSIEKGLYLQHTDERFHKPSFSAKQKGVGPERSYSDVEIARAFTTYLQQHHLDNWRVVIDDTKTAISISSVKNQIFVPKDRIVGEKYLQGLIAHEIGVHALRREHGLRTKLKILSTGLDRTKDDEGVAMYEQQKITGMSDFAGLPGYLSISLALGADGHKRGFREVFAVMVDYYLINGKNFKDAQNAAWSQCIRTFRGTTCQTPGACFTKDLVYRDNNIGVWYLVKNDSPEVRRFSVGKYDPTNPRHVWILDQFNITEKDLDLLEK